MTIAPKKHEKTTIERDGKTWNWCKFHKKWVVAKSAKFGEHSSDTCLLNPKNQNKQKEKKLKVVANLAQEDNVTTSGSESEMSESTESGTSSE